MFMFSLGCVSTTPAVFMLWRSALCVHVLSGLCVYHSSRFHVVEVCTVCSCSLWAVCLPLQPFSCCGGLHCVFMFSLGCVSTTPAVFMLWRSTVCSCSLWAVCLPLQPFPVFLDAVLQESSWSAFLPGSRWRLPHSSSGITSITPHDMPLPS